LAEFHFYFQQILAEGKLVTRFLAGSSRYLWSNTMAVGKFTFLHDLNV